jgi:hypothetical protein
MRYVFAAKSFAQAGAITTVGLLSLAAINPIQVISLRVTPGMNQAAIAAPPPSNGPSHQKQDTAAVPPVPPMPETIPNPINPDPTGIVGLVPDPDDPIGVGHLRPKDIDTLAAADNSNPTGTGSPTFDANWLRGVALPIYNAPNGDNWGWIINGWLIADGYEPIAIGRDAAFSMLQTYYETYTFPVLEVREDGWFRFQYTPAGTAWAHTSQLDLGQIDLTIETWEDRFAEVGWVKFRRHGVSQPLRPEPSSSSSLISLISPDSYIEAIEFKDDWMRVRVTQPVEGCDILPGATTSEGWMRWREAGESLVWYPAKGC